MRYLLTRLPAVARVAWLAIVVCAVMGGEIGSARGAEDSKQPRNPFDRLNEPAAEPEPSAEAPSTAAVEPAAEPDGETQPVEAAPIYDRFPFDRIFVKANLVRAGEPEFHEVARLDFPGRTRPESPRSGDKLVFRFLDNLDEQYEIRWGDVERIELFEEMVMAEAQQKLDAGKLVEAFKYYQWLDRNSPNFPGVKEAVELFLYKDAVAQAKDKKFDVALAVLGELHERNRDFNGLQRAMSATVSKLIEDQVRRKNFLEARRLLRDLTDRYPEDKAVTDWADRFAKEAEKRLAEARKLLKAKKLSEAQHAVTDAVRVWPTLPEARAMAVEQNKRYPVVTVGVTGLPQQQLGSAGWKSLATLRGERLLDRKLIELNDYDRNGEGGVYVCPFGQIERTELGLNLLFRLNGDVRWSDGSGLLNGYDVSQTLLAMADPRSATYCADWRELFTSVAVRNVHQVEVRLHHTHVRPDALLQTEIKPWQRATDDSGGAASNGPYQIASRSADGIRYRYNAQYFALGEGQPREIEERLYADGKQAVRALADGEIAVLERVNPWQLKEVAEIPRVKIAPYAVPTVHCLWPNLKRPFIEHRSFRRALVYGVHREAILKKVLLRGREGEELAECQTITAPFPRGYAYNEKAPQREYDGRQAVTLARIVQYSVLKKAEKDKKIAAPVDAPAAPAASAAAEAEVKIVPVSAAADEEDATEADEEDAKAAAAPPQDSRLPPLPEFVLAHPPTELAFKACSEIQRHLAAIQINITLREMPPDQLLSMPEDVDLLYVELPVREPVVEARRLLGSDGLVGSASPYMDLALRQLAEATDWKSARDRLLYVHQLAYDELTLIPLWQMTEFFAYREDVRGIARRPVNLYQSIENWQVPAWFPPDAQ